MRSRVTSTRRKVPDWRTWLLFDYVRYWYAVGVILLLVFGVGDLVRVLQPLTPAEAIALVLLSVAIVFLGILGYAILWRRDSRVARWARDVSRPIRDLLSKGRRTTLPERAEAAPDPPLPQPEVPGENDDDRREREDARRVE